MLVPGLTLREALDRINYDANIEDIYIAPPEPDSLTDEDSVDED